MEDEKISLKDLKEELTKEIRKELNLDGLLGGLDFGKKKRREHKEFGEAAAAAILYLVKKLGNTTEFNQKEIRGFEYVKRNPFLWKFCRDRPDLKRHLDRKSATEMQKGLKDLATAFAKEVEEEKEKSWLARHNPF